MADTEEVWAPAPACPKYEVSTLGRVRNLKTLKGIKPSKRDYSSVYLASPGGHKTVRIHHLVAKAFIPNPENKRAVRHKNGNPRDHSVTNLEWATHQSIRQRLRKRVQSIDPMTGETEEYSSIEAAATAAGVDKARMYNCAERHHSTIAGKFWRYAEDWRPNEQWREIAECDGFQLARARYAVSNLGRVRNEKNGGVLHPTDSDCRRVINLAVDGGGGSRRRFAVHRLVAAAFVRRPEGWSWGWEVVALDGDLSNAAATNLRWSERASHTREERAACAEPPHVENAV